MLICHSASVIKTHVRSLHIATDIEARPACEFADLIHQQLASSPMRIDAAAHSEATEPRVVPKHLEQFIDYGGDHVIAAEPLVERRSSSFLDHGNGIIARTGRKGR